MSIKQRKVRRFDIATILESAFEQNEWKGNDHHRGVFFTDDKGYCVNKVLAVRANHEEKAPKVFYSFLAPSIEERVTLEYPYQNMEAKPKKHHLLIDKPVITEEEIDKIFSVSPVDGEITIVNNEIYDLIQETVPNKRERDRTQIEWRYTKSGMESKVIRSKNNTRKVLAEKNFNDESFQWGNVENYRVKVNANTLHTVLRIFPEKTKVLFQFARDRMKLTGSLSTVEGYEARVEVVLSLMKSS